MSEIKLLFTVDRYVKQVCVDKTIPETGTCCVGKEFAGDLQSQPSSSDYRKYGHLSEVIVPVIPFLWFPLFWSSDCRKSAPLSEVIMPVVPSLEIPHSSHLNSSSLLI